MRLRTKVCGLEDRIRVWAEGCSVLARFLTIHHCQGHSGVTQREKSPFATQACLFLFVLNEDVCFQYGAGELWRAQRTDRAPTVTRTRPYYALPH